MIIISASGHGHYELGKLVSVAGSLGFDCHGYKISADRNARKSKLRRTQFQPDPLQ